MPPQCNVAPFSSNLVAEVGIEPTVRVYETLVLPLHYPTIKLARAVGVEPTVVREHAALTVQSVTISGHALIVMLFSVAVRTKQNTFL